MYSYTQTYTHTYTHTHTHTPVRTHDDVVAIDFYADGVVKIVELVVELNARPKEHTRNTQALTRTYSRHSYKDTYQGLNVDRASGFGFRVSGFGFRV